MKFAFVILIIADITLAQSFSIDVLQLLTSSILTTDVSESKCMTKLKSMLPPNVSDPVVLAMLMYSSHNINDLGNYKQCIATNGTRYVLLKSPVVAEQPSFMTVSVCAPSECTIEDFNVLKHPLYTYLKKMMIDNGINVDSGSMHFTEDNLVFVDSYQESIEGTKITIGPVITLSLLIVLLLVVIIATIMDYNSKSEAMFVNTFSAIKAIKSLFGNTNPVDSNLNVLNGVRVISIIWVVLGHSFAFVGMVMAPNTTDITYTMKYPKWFAMITGATVSVDTFFALSGFLSALSSVNIFQKKENRSVKTVLKCIAMRYLRLTPLLGLTMLLEVNIFSILFKGPIHNFWNGTVSQCMNYFYTNLLYINNFLHPQYSCVGWTWYIACDFQFYIFSFLIAIPFAIKKSYGYISMGLTALVSTVLQVVLISHYKLSSSYLSQGGNYMEIYYFKPYTRINTYLIGIFIAWLFTSFKQKEKNDTPSLQKINDMIVNNKIFRYTLYTFGFALTTASVFLEHLIDYYLDSVKVYQNVLYIVLSRPAFIFGMFMIIYPVMIGRGRPLFAFLGAPFMSPLAKLTYGVYMIHILLMNTETFTMQSYLFFSSTVSFMWTLHEYLLSIIFSLVMSLLVESPFLKIEKALFVGKPREKVEYSSVETKINDKSNE